ELAKKIGAMQPGAKVNLTLLENGSEKTVSVELGQLPNTQEARATTPDSGSAGTADLGKLGLTLAPASRVAGRDAKGVMVTGVDSSGVAAEHGFTQGDVILSVNGKQVSTPADV